MNEEPKNPKRIFSSPEDAVSHWPASPLRLQLFYAEERLPRTGTRGPSSSINGRPRVSVLKWPKIVPPPVPDEQNFAMTPIVFTSYGNILTRDGKVIPSDKRDQNFEVRMRIYISHDNTIPKNSEPATGSKGSLHLARSHGRLITGNGRPRPMNFRIPTWPSSQPSRKMYCSP